MSTYNSIREATPLDVDKIAQVHAKCWREVYSFMPEKVLSNRNFDYRVRQWSEWFADRPKSEALFALVHGQEVVGFSVCKPNEDPAIPVPGELHACYILQEHRGSELGPLGLIAIASYLKDAGLWPACLWAFKSNPYRRIYPQLGCNAEVFRDRIIANSPLPEIGYRLTDYETFVSRLERMRVSAAQRQMKLPQRQRHLERLHG